MGTKTKKILSGMAILGSAGIIVTLAFIGTTYVQSNEEAQVFIANMGYLGVMVVAIIAGLNVIVPFPAASIVPAVTAAGLWLPGIIAALALGTLIADFIGYLIGHYSKDTVATRYPIAYRTIEIIVTDCRPFIFPALFLYASFMPFPNEIMILPLAVLGIRFRYMIVPLLCGNVVNQTLWSLGITNVFAWLL
jgi:membrane protein YqaA with SNARE-associated domain